MKKRLRKKLEKRVGRMHYSDARMTLLMRTIKRDYPDTSMVIDHQDKEENTCSEALMKMSE